MKKIFKSNRDIVKLSVEHELYKTNPNIENIMEFIDEYQSNNTKEINNLKRDKIVTTNKISGALKQTINAHGPIDYKHIASATKRIYGSFLVSNNVNNFKIKFWYLFVIIFSLLLYTYLVIK